MRSIAIDHRPSDYEYALLSQHIYKKPQKSQTLSTDSGTWDIVFTQEDARGFYGAIYQNKTTKQLVVVYRGTHDNITWLENYSAVYKNGKDTVHKLAAFELARRAVELAKKEGWQLSFTGHSLGAFLAEMSVYFCHQSYDYPHVNAVTFESPGTKESMEILKSNHEPVLLERLDIISYLSYPNIVNTCNHHVSSLYNLHPNLQESNFGWITGEVSEIHSMSNIVSLFKKGRLEAREYLRDWPMGSQRDTFYQYAERKEKQGVVLYQITEQQREAFSKAVNFKLDYDAHYKPTPKLSHMQVLPLRHFSMGMQRFLTFFYDIRRVLIDHDKEKTNVTTDQWLKSGVPMEVLKSLLTFQIEEDHTTGLRYIVLPPDGDLHQFRQTLTTWLFISEHEQKLYLFSSHFEKTTEKEEVTVSSEKLIEMRKLHEESSEKTEKLLLLQAEKGQLGENTQAYRSKVEQIETIQKTIDQTNKKYNDLLNHYAIDIKQTIEGIVTGSVKAEGGNLTNVPPEKSGEAMKHVKKLTDSGMRVDQTVEKEASVGEVSASLGNIIFARQEAAHVPALKSLSDNNNNNSTQGSALVSKGPSLFCPSPTKTPVFLMKAENILKEMLENEIYCKNEYLGPSLGELKGKIEFCKKTGFNQVSKQQRDTIRDSIKDILEMKDEIDQSQKKTQLN